MPTWTEIKEELLALKDAKLAVGAIVVVVIGVVFWLTSLIYVERIELLKTRLEAPPAPETRPQVETKPPAQLSPEEQWAKTDKEWDVYPLIPVDGKRFMNEVVVLDGRHFTDCKF